jgi:hypothetical protein
MASESMTNVLASGPHYGVILTIVFGTITTIVVALLSLWYPGSDLHHNRQARKADKRGYRDDESRDERREQLRGISAEYLALLDEACVAIQNLVADAADAEVEYKSAQAAMTKLRVYGHSTVLMAFQPGDEKSWVTWSVGQCWNLLEGAMDKAVAARREGQSGDRAAQTRQEVDNIVVNDVDGPPRNLVRWALRETAAQWPAPLVIDAEHSRYARWTAELTGRHLPDHLLMQLAPESSL